MQRSFGGMGGGNGGGGGGRMIRTVQRVRSGVGGASAEPISPKSSTTTIKTNTNLINKTSSPPNTALTLSSSSSSAGFVNNGNSNNGSSCFSHLVNNFPVSSVAAGAGGPELSDCTSPRSSEDFEWERVDGFEDEMGRVRFDEFWRVPSGDEVNHAVSALQQVFGPPLYTGVANERYSDDSSEDVTSEVATPRSFGKGISSVEAAMDWVEPSMQLRDSNRVYDAFHMLQTDPSVKRMVISLSSDKAVWDAVMNNEVVKEVKCSIEADKELGERDVIDKGSDDSNPIKDFMLWVVVNAKAKIMQLIDTISKLVNEILQPANKERKGSDADPLEDKLKTSLFLSVIVLLIVVVTRAQSA